jgi:hypothetical protein
MKAILTTALLMWAASPVLANQQAETKYTINGVLSVYASYEKGITLSDYKIGSKCVIFGRASDLNNISISVRNGKGELIGTAEADIGIVTENGGGLATCSIPFAITDVPKSDFYSIKLGNRGTLDYSFSQMVDNEWKMNLSFGL